MEFSGLRMPKHFNQFNGQGRVGGVGGSASVCIYVLSQFCTLVYSQPLLVVRISCIRDLIYSARIESLKLEGIASHRDYNVEIPA
jgi:hypothetical protein